MKDLNECISLYGLDRTFEALQVITNKCKTMMEEPSLKSQEQKLEFDLFAFSYYLSFLKSKGHNRAYHMLQEKTYSFYTDLIEYLIDKFPHYRNEEFLFVSNINEYVISKVDFYKDEIGEISKSLDYRSKYIFASFFIYTLMSSDDIKKQSSKIDKNNLNRFQLELKTIIQMLESSAENLKEYVSNW